MTDTTSPHRTPAPPGSADASTPSPTVPATSADAQVGPGRALVAWVFWPSTVIVLAFVIATMLLPEQMTAAIGTVQQGIITSFSWWYAAVALFFVLFCLYLAFSRKGQITMGKPDEKPEFSTLSWFSLLFAAGMGIGLVFFGVAEPIQHYAAPPVGEGGTIDAAR